jgi:acyl-CoA thioesterase FadM
MLHIIWDEKNDTPELVATITCVGVMIHYESGITFPIPEDVKEKIRAFEKNPSL